jgi:hypothetical protein
MKLLNLHAGKTLRDDIAWGSSMFADVGYLFSANVHFDGKNFQEIQANWKQINKNIDDIDIDSWNLQFGGYDAARLGRNLHSIQDFYSHSNYIELYVEYYKEKNDGNLPLIGRIPTYDEVISNSQKHSEFYKKLQQNLHAGEFNLDPYAYDKERDYENVHSNGQDHHDDIAKDNLKMGKYITNKAGKKLNTHLAARDVATRHTAKVIKEKLK